MKYQTELKKYLSNSLIRPSLGNPEFSKLELRYKNAFESSMRHGYIHGFFKPQVLLGAAIVQILFWAFIATISSMYGSIISSQAKAQSDEGLIWRLQGADKIWEP